jgi:probable HAF family extracellular repeat protein
MSALFVTSPCRAGGVYFEDLGRRDRTVLGSQAMGVSPDGQYIVGYAERLNAQHSADRMATMWPLAGGVISLGDLPGQRIWGEARGVSNDGTVVVGHSEAGYREPGAFRWTATEGMVLLNDDVGSGVEFSEANAVSADGNVIVGTTDVAGVAGRQAFRWSEAGGMETIGHPSWSNHSNGEDVSDDGSTIVGPTASGLAGFHWTEQDGFTIVGPKINEIAVPQGVSADGSVVVGERPGAFRWTESDGFAVFGTGFPLAVSGDGSVIVGSEFGPDARNGAFIWDAVHGQRSLKAVLENDYGLDLSKWELTLAFDVSADGRTIAGSGWHEYGLYGNKAYTAWVAVIPEPGSAAWLTVGLAVMWRRQ